MPVTNKRRKVEDEGSSSKTQIMNQDVAWLQTQLEQRHGYADFTANHHQKLHNPDRAKFWAFAAQFSADYHKKLSPITVRLYNWVKPTTYTDSSRKGQHVTKSAISMALRMGTTALVEAENLTRIIKLYGTGGSACSKDVVQELDHVDETAPGAGAFSEFLRNWEKHHPKA